MPILASEAVYFAEGQVHAKVTLLGLWLALTLESHTYTRSFLSVLAVTEELEMPNKVLFKQ